MDHKADNAKDTAWSLSITHPYELWWRSDLT